MSVSADPAETGPEHGRRDSEPTEGVRPLDLQIAVTSVRPTRPALALSRGACD
jgi:hypothetical protein